MRIILKPLLCSVDTVARPILRNRVQFNGHYGCSWCYSFCDYIGGSVRYLLKETDPLIRTHESHLTDMEAVMKVTKAQESRKKNPLMALQDIRCYPNCSH